GRRGGGRVGRGRRDRRVDVRLELDRRLDLREAQVTGGEVDRVDTEQAATGVLELAVPQHDEVLEPGEEVRQLAVLAGHGRGDGYRLVAGARRGRRVERLDAVDRHTGCARDGGEVEDRARRVDAVRHRLVDAEQIRDAGVVLGARRGDPRECDRGARLADLAVERGGLRPLRRDE